MASIQELKTRIDLHDLAEKLGLQKPKGQGNYRSPHHKDNMPSLSIFNGGRAFKDHSAGDTPHSKGSFLDLIMYVEGLHDEGEALRRAHEIYNIPFDAPQRPAERQMSGRIETAQQRKLQRGNVGLGVHQFEWNKQAVVESTLRVDPSRYVVLEEQFRNPMGKIGISGRGVGDVIGFPGKTVVIVEHGRIGRAQQRGCLLLPVRADDKDGIRHPESRGKPQHEIHHRPVAGVPEDGQGTSAV